MIKTTKRVSFIAAIVSFVLPAVAAHGAMIDVGTILLAPNQVNAPTSINVSGGESLYLLDFCAQVGDGRSGPKISSVDLTSGIFSVNNAGQSSLNLALPSGMSPDYAIGYTIFRRDAGQDVFASGLLASIVFDTTGLFSGEWQLALTGVAASEENSGRDTQMIDFDSRMFVDTQILSGTLRIIPEPSSLLLAMCGIGVLGAVGVTRARTRRTMSP